MIDLHCHILSGLDDGSPDIDTTLAMLHMAHQNHTRGIVATPHIMAGTRRPTWPEIIDGCRSLTISAQEAGLDVEVFPGAEVSMVYEHLEIITGPGLIV